MLNSLQRNERDYIVFPYDIEIDWDNVNEKTFKDLSFKKFMILIDNDYISTNDNIKDSNIKIYNILDFSQKWYVKYIIKFFGHCTKNETIIKGFVCTPRENKYENFDCLIDFEKISRKCTTYKISKDEMELNPDVDIKIEDYIKI